MFENNTTEFKREYTDNIKYSAVAFANTEGGKIFIGITDDGTVAGIENPDETMLQLGNMLRDSIRPDITMFTEYHTEMMKVTELKAIPDAAYAKGVSAPFCGVVGDALVVAGGANFPDKSLLDGGAKRVYADIWAQADGEWAHAGVLPDSTAYGATFAVDGALVLAGGNVCGTTTDKVYELTFRDRAAVLRALPPLPVPMEQCGWTRDGDRLYLVGGVGTTGVYACTVGEYVWTKLADLPEPLVQPVAFASAGKLYVWGGFNPETLEVSDKGLVIPTDSSVIPSEAKESLWAEAPAIPDGGTFVGATGATLPDGRLVVVGGVNRAIFARGTG